MKETINITFNEPYRSYTSDVELGKYYTRVLRQLLKTEERKKLIKTLKLL